MKPRLSATNLLIFVLGLALMYSGFRGDSFAICALGSLLACSAVALAYHMRWALWTALAGLVALAVLFGLQIGLRGISLQRALGMAGVSFLLWDVIRELRRVLRRRNQPLVAIVQLRRRADNFLTDRKLAEVAERIWGKKFNTAEGDAGDCFVVGCTPNFVINAPELVLLVNNSSTQYFEDTEQAAADIPELRTRHAILNHTSWLSVDVLSMHDPAKPPTDAYPLIAKFLAELLDEDCLALFCPETGRFVPYDASVVEKLRGPNPLDIFGELAFAPVIQISDDDPRMKAAVEEARRRWPEFVDAFNARSGERFAFKAPITVEDNTEFIWVDLDRIEGATLHGKLANDPVALGDLKCGDAVTAKLDDVNDWSYLRDGEIVGGFSMKVLAEMSRK